MPCNSVAYVRLANMRAASGSCRQACTLARATMPSHESMPCNGPSANEYEQELSIIQNTDGHWYTHLLGLDSRFCSPLPHHRPGQRQLYCFRH
jgi:hypothetical protein